MHLVAKEGLAAMEVVEVTFIATPSGGLMATPQVGLVTKVTLTGASRGRPRAPRRAAAPRRAGG